MHVWREGGSFLLEAGSALAEPPASLVQKLSASPGRRDGCPQPTPGQTELPAR